MNYLLIFFTIIFFITQTLSLKLVRVDAFPQKLLINCLFTLFAAIIMIFSGFFFPSIFQIGKVSLYCGILFGILFSLTMLFYLSAISCGSLSYTSFYLSSSMLLPVFAGIFLFHEKISVSLIIALLFFLGAFYFLNATEKQFIRSHKWILLCILTFICNGSAGIVQKIQQFVSPGKESSGFILTGFATASVCYLIAYLLTYNKQGVSYSLNILKNNILPILLLSVSSLFGNLLLTFLAGTFSGSYLFPLVQGSIIIGVTLCSTIFFKENLTRNGKFGILFGTIGIILINI